MRFDVLGRVVMARVTSIRDVEWEDSRNGGFMFVFRPGPLSQAPHTYIGIIRAPEGAQERAAFQHDLVTAYPNVSAIDVREVLASVKEVIDNVTLAISIVGGIALFGGVLILVGAVAMTKFQRVYEAAILRTLGASSRTLGSHARRRVHGARACWPGVIGAAGALALSWAVCRFVFEIDWKPATGILLAGARDHHDPGGGYRRGGQRRRSAEETAGDAEGRMSGAAAGRKGCEGCGGCERGAGGCTER